MKIGSYDTTPTVGTTAAGERKSTSQARAADDAAEPSTTVQLSSAAATTGAAGDGSFDAAKVERIAKAIQDGSFKVDAGAIADKLIANAQELLGRTSR